MLWTAEASTLAGVVYLNPLTRKMTEAIAREEGASAVEPAHIYEALKTADSHYDFNDPVSGSRPESRKMDHVRDNNNMTR